MGGDWDSWLVGSVWSLVDWERVESSGNWVKFVRRSRRRSNWIVGGLGKVCLVFSHQLNVLLKVS